jgi:hypothetical protein
MDGATIAVSEREHCLIPARPTYTGRHLRNRRNSSIGETRAEGEQHWLKVANPKIECTVAVTDTVLWRPARATWSLSSAARSAAERANRGQDREAPEGVRGSRTISIGRSRGGRGRPQGPAERMAGVLFFHGQATSAAARPTLASGPVRVSSAAFSVARSVSSALTRRFVHMNRSGAPDRIRTCDLCLRSPKRRYTPQFLFVR